MIVTPTGMDTVNHMVHHIHIDMDVDADVIVAVVIRAAIIVTHIVDVAVGGEQWEHGE
jgi:hypothetical protein